MTQPYPHTPNDPDRPPLPAVHEPKVQPIHAPVPGETPELPGPPPRAPEPVIQPLPQWP